MKTPGTALEMKRRENNMTQEEVAKYLGISRNTLAAYESGKQKIPLTVFIYLADLYKCDVYEILSVHANDVEYDTDETELINVDFPAFGIPKSPTSAINLSSSPNSLITAGSPGSQNCGALF